MAILALVLFGGGTIVAFWSMYATVRPQFARIVDLLVHGPVAAPTMPVRVASRSSLRNVRVRGSSQRPTPAARLRAAA